MELALAAECWQWVLNFRSLEKYTLRSFSVLISSSVSLEPVSADIMVSLEEVQKGSPDHLHDRASLLNFCPFTYESPACFAQVVHSKMVWLCL
ncbi:hypothetical protein BpHYR1_012416 [Brachionus plicatilis]|uniref:Uncharacterized protein n=1 Tax=Brachionus plicatilis TaxID=10195 RepID=A0A3M7QPV8_BRAPC|nr:hypothetical protein BpHYR1_012416 [Brachionus plicatilis]